MNLFPFLKKKKPLLGVDLGHKSLKAIRLNRIANQEVLDFCASAEIGEGISPFDSLKQFVHQHRLQGSEAAVCLDDPSLKIRRVELPKMPEADLKEAVRWKLRDVVEGSVEDYIVRTSQMSDISSPGEKKTVVIGYAVKKNAVDSTLHDFERSGLKPQFMEPQAVSLASACHRAAASSKEWIGGIDFGATKTIMVILGDGKVAYSRPLPGIDLALAAADAESFRKRAAAEIQNTIDSFIVMYRVEAVKKLFLTGGGALIKELGDYLGTNLGIGTSLLQPFEGIEVDQRFAGEVEKNYRLYANAVSLARI